MREEKLTLEEAFVKLNEIITNLEKEDITLETSFQAYQEGMKTIQYCNGLIDQVEKKVLVIDELGDLNEF